MLKNSGEKKKPNLTKIEVLNLSAVIFKEKLLEATFARRLNRFLALVQMDSRTLPSFLPNPGRMHELLKPGTKVVLRELKKKGRKTFFDLVGVYHKSQIITVDSRIPNKLVSVALQKREIQEFAGYTKIKPEYNYGHTRFDFLLLNNSKPCLLEVKSCTLVKDGKALFPDAVTRRGRKHVKELAEARIRGYRACLLFIVQRNDASVFSPNDKTDPKFGKAIREAAKKGVETYAYSSEFVRNKVVLGKKLRVDF